MLRLLKPSRRLLVLLLTGFSANTWACTIGQAIDEVLPNGSRWDLCWDMTPTEGLRLHELFFTTADGTRRKVMKQANLAEIQLSFADGRATRLQVTDVGAGLGANGQAIDSGSCPGSLLTSTLGPQLCSSIIERGYAYKSYNVVKQGHALTLLASSYLQGYGYAQQWQLSDDGSISAAIGSSGDLRAFSTDSTVGWPLDGANRIGVAFKQRYFWRLDFDLGNNAANDLVEEISVIPSSDRRRKTKQITAFGNETSRALDANTKRSWRVRDAQLTNADGRYISYHLEPLHAAHSAASSANEPWAQHDFAVTRHNPCERYIVNNADSGCTDDLSGYLNGQSLNNQDIVLWHNVTYHHTPRSEDEPSIGVHWDGFTVIPRDWSATNPLN